MIATTPFFSDRGCSIRVLDSYLRLKKENNDIILLTYNLGREINGVKTKRIVKIPFYKNTAPGFNFFKIFADVLLLLKSIFVYKSDNFNYIYAHTFEAALIGVILKKIFKTTIVFDAQGSLVGELASHKTISKDGFIATLLRKIEKYIVLNSDEIVTSTDGLKEFFGKEFGRRYKIKAIKDLPNKMLFNKNIKKIDLDLPKNKIIVGYLGGLQPYKGVDFILDAIPYIDENFYFLIMGYPLDYVNKKIKELNIQKRVTLTGKVPYEKAGGYLKNLDIAISPKLLGSSGEANAKLYIYKYLNLKNIVCFDIDENRKILGKNGIYIKNQTPESLAKTVNRIIDVKAK